jgi:hypothetical protein
MTRCQASALGAVLVAATALAPATATAQSLRIGGALGAGYNRSDAGTSSFEATTSAWDFAGQLSMSGSPIASNLLWLNASGGYQRVNTTTELSEGNARNWSYQANATALQATPLSLTVSASQAWTRNTVTAGSVPGDTFSRTQGATAALSLPDAPRLTGSYARALTTTQRPGASDVDLDFTTVGATLADAGDKVRYSLDYRSAWSGGSLVQTNFRNHFVNLAASAQPDSDVQVQVGESYFVRVPTVESPLNPRIDANNFSTALTLYPGATLGGTITYTYGHALSSAPDVESTETQSHAISGMANYRMSDAWLGQLGVTAAHALVRANGAESANDGQSLLAMGTWRRALDGRSSLFSKLSANVGAVEPDGGPTQTAFGGGADLGVSGALGSVDGSVSYGASFQKNGVSLEGSYFEQRALVNGSTHLGFALVRASLQGTLSRRDDALLGSTASRSVIVNGDLVYKHFTAIVSGNLQDGLSSASGLSGVDGIVLPASYDTHSRFAAVRLSYAVEQLDLSLGWQWDRIRTPGTPWQSDDSLLLGVGWRVGQFTIQVEDRYWLFDSGFSQSRINTFFVRALRSFQVL